jgi:excinuclease UvrABC ATPase subunit
VLGINHLKKVSFRKPYAAVTVVSGVSGSDTSMVVEDALYRDFAHAFARPMQQERAGALGA